MTRLMFPRGAHFLVLAPFLGWVQPWAAVSWDRGVGPREVSGALVSLIFSQHPASLQIQISLQDHTSV